MQTQDYYTAQQAQEILNMTYSALRNQVILGNIRKIIPPGRRQAVYLKADVDALKQDMEAFGKKRHQPKTRLPHTKFVKATEEDMPAAVELAHEVFGGLNTIPVEKRIDWLRKNPDIDYLLKQGDKIVGYLSLVPLRPETIDDLMSLRRYAKDLTVDDILAYTPGEPIDIYGMAIGVKPGVSAAQKHEWGKVLIVGARSVILNLARRGIVIRSIVAHSSTPDGIKMMRHLGFTETIPKVPGLRDFIIEVERSGIPFIEQYHELLKQWQEAHETDRHADIKIDSEHGAKTRDNADISEQNGTDKKARSRLKSHTTKA